jgi:hypothetical protein
MSLHTVLFNKYYWNINSIVDWLYEHNIQPIKGAREQENYIRTRIRDPKLFKSFYTVKIPKQHIQLVIGRT